MARSLLEDAFGHHVWATLRLIDACAALDPTQLETEVPGTYGSIIDTMRHLVGADASYLFVTSGGRSERIDEDAMDLAALRAAMEADGTGWAALLKQDLDPDVVLVRHRDDGSATEAPLGIRLAQALHHGTDHRSQICTALTTLGVEPPSIDVWDFGDLDGRLVEFPPSTP
ncbi:MAG: DinB family protein [Planctomycetaceae bacterium]